MNDNKPKLSLNPIGSLFSEAWKLYKERYSVLMEIVLLPVLVAMLGYILIGINVGFVFSALGGLALFVGYVLFAFSVLPVIFSIHHATGVDESYKATIGWFWPFVWVMILEILATIGAFWMLIIPGIWLGLSLSLVAYVFVIEGRRDIDALRQSKDYIKGYWWALAGRLILLSLIFLAAILIIELPIGLIAGRTAASIVSIVLELFYIPFAASYSYTIFGNLRTLKPELAGVHTKEGTGFIKTSAIVGIVLPIIIVIAAIALAGTGVFSAMRNGSHYVPGAGYDNMQNPY